MDAGTLDLDLPLPEGAKLAELAGCTGSRPIFCTLRGGPSSCGNRPGECAKRTVKPGRESRRRNSSSHGKVLAPVEVSPILV
eukprot:6475057-Amphidinium_carterae.1